jgi:hypothetical protein
MFKHYISNDSLLLLLTFLNHHFGNLNYYVMKAVLLYSPDWQDFAVRIMYKCMWNNTGDVEYMKEWM